ncbi:hypothetical protein, partial [Erwinia sorbitola]|uniref:hypothetical protein n=1 Tax=Erwinia sorbitola TaxID=2681984 RepID=UPI001E32DAD8
TLEQVSAAVAAVQQPASVRVGGADEAAAGVIPVPVLPPVVTLPGQLPRGVKVKGDRPVLILGTAVRPCSTCIWVNISMLIYWYIRTWSNA